MKHLIKIYIIAITGIVIWGFYTGAFKATKPEPTNAPISREIAPTTIVKEKVVQVPVIKTVTKTETIKVADPALQVKIDSLVAENNALQSQVSRLTSINQKLANQSYQAPTQSNPPVAQTPMNKPQCSISVDASTPDLNGTIIIKWTTTDATSGQLQFADGMSDGTPKWYDVWDLTKDWNEGGVSQGSTLASGHYFLSNPLFAQIVVKGAGGTTTCRLK